MLLLTARCSNAHSIALNLIDFNSRLHSFANFLHCKIHSSYSQAIHISNNLHVSSHRLQINSKINRAARLCPVVCPRRKMCFILRYSELFLTKTGENRLNTKRLHSSVFMWIFFFVFSPRHPIAYILNIIIVVYTWMSSSCAVVHYIINKSSSCCVSQYQYISSVQEKIKRRLRVVAGNRNLFCKLVHIKKIISYIANLFTRKLYCMLLRYLKCICNLWLYFSMSWLSVTRANYICISHTFSRTRLLGNCTFMPPATL